MNEFAQEYLARRARLGFGPVRRPAAATRSALDLEANEPALPVICFAPIDLLDRRGWRVIVSLVCLRYGVSVRDMLGPTRRHEIVVARQKAMQLIYSHCRMSTPEIGRRFGRDHSTVVHAINLGRGRNRKGWKPVKRTARKFTITGKRNECVASEIPGCSMEDRHSNFEAVE